ncbi:GNAT family N-acetyltransferase [Peterkaempfera bronchialis]|uniref:GNAT family N-acetyltransferase n=1 Tax=Peterkaempfera bronchialis TaxID=2126346 RepID=UPI003C2E6D8B
MLEETITHLRMTAPDQLRPGRPVESVRLRPTEDAALVRTLQDRMAAPHRWPGPAGSDREQWPVHPLRGRWLVADGTEPVGLVELAAGPDGRTELTAFGLVPERVGQGLGGHALTLAVRLAWEFRPQGGPVRGVRLHTSDLDHPHALPNCLGRGFRRYGVEVRQRTGG